MRISTRLAATAAAFAFPFALPAAAFAATGAVTLQVPGTDHCVYAQTPTAQYNNGDPTMQAGYAYADSCAFPG